MFNVRLAGDHLHGKWLFTWLSLVMSLMVSYFVLSFFPRDVLDNSGIELSQFLRILLPAFNWKMYSLLYRCERCRNV